MGADHESTTAPTAHILVVCTANIARSPLAAAMLTSEVERRQLQQQIRVTSAGVQARDGLPAADHSIRVAAAAGLDLSQHRSRPTYTAGPEDADLVITMSERQRDHLGSRIAGMAARCFTLPELARLLRDIETASLPSPGPERVRVASRAAHQRRPFGGPEVREDVADPYGQPRPAYEVLADRLEDLLTDVVPALLGPVRTPPGR